MSLPGVFYLPDFKIGGVWGDAIYWANREEFEKDITEESVFTVYGFKSNMIFGKRNNRPKVGDILQGDFSRTWIFFEFIEIKWEDNPPDMFWGKVKPIDQLPKTAEAKKELEKINS